MGYDPNYKNTMNSVFEGDSYAFITCNFRSSDYNLGISSGDRTVAEQKPIDDSLGAVTSVSVAGRQGYIARNPSHELSCVLFFETSYGEIIMSRIQGEKPQSMGLDVCDGIVKTAEILASTLPKGV